MGMLSGIGLLLGWSDVPKMVYVILEFLPFSPMGMGIAMQCAIFPIQFLHMLPACCVLSENWGWNLCRHLKRVHYMFGLCGRGVGNALPINTIYLNAQAAKLQDDNKALDRLTKSKETALLEAERTIQIALAKASLVDELQNKNQELMK
ncbi:hypothetical protein IFM89_022122 [Coptis chinensis]|uniref:Uncharacterized protein n=1 Tax=Coptis chinensis TaxID=261450 RepID=A0A835LR12_9MAGN|nr:hypothetical protein IFM89_022122 [Coptis chinensis]